MAIGCGLKARRLLFLEDDLNFGFSASFNQRHELVFSANVDQAFTIHAAALYPDFSVLPCQANYYSTAHQTSAFCDDEDQLKVKLV